MHLDVKFMTGKIIFKFYFIFYFLLVVTAYGQNSVSISTPIFRSTIEVPNNWNPPTTVNRQNQFDGTSLGLGINLNYSFSPKFLFKARRILVTIGAGYFKQRFDVVRPFDYTSPLFPIFYTDHYSYHCWSALIGLSYNYVLGENYFLSGQLSYSWLRSFRQDYTPTSNYGYGDLTQTEYHQIDFGNIANLAIGINRNFGKQFSLGLSVLTPLYIRWRNDKIFKDDPSKFSDPKFSLGTALIFAYRLEKKH